MLRALHIEPPTDVHHLPCSMPDEGAPSSSRARGSKAYTAVDIGDADASETVGEMDGVPLDSKTISPHKLKSKREKGDSKPVSNLQLIVLIPLALIGIGISSKVAYAMVKSNDATSVTTDASPDSSSHIAAHAEHSAKAPRPASTWSSSLPPYPPPPPSPLPWVQSSAHALLKAPPPSMHASLVELPETVAHTKGTTMERDSDIRDSKTPPKTTIRPPPGPPPPPKYLGGIFEVLHITNEEEAEPSPPPSPPAPPPPPPPMPPIGTWSAVLNERFQRNVREHDIFEAGVLIHQFDGFEDANLKVSPCTDVSQTPNCLAVRNRQRRQRVSTSFISSGLKSRDSSIPLFSLDGGVILRPSDIHALCGYGTDGGTDDSKPLACNSPKCIPGCGEPPLWCSMANVEDDGPGARCGFGRGKGGVRPWKSEELSGPGGLFDVFEKHGEGYNEVVVSPDAWIANLPHSIEGIFYVECEDDAENIHFRASDGSGTAANCQEAREAAIAAHGQVLTKYSLSQGQFPLFKLRTSNWADPFIEV